MKKKVISILIVFLLVFGLFRLLNVEVVTMQGINFKVSRIKIPLYLKILDFLDRHYNYKNLVTRITKNKHTEEEKVMAILKWTYENIKRQPKELPVIDDHIWSIIDRGYGVEDQFNEVFVTLCNYAGIKAYYSFVLNENKNSSIPLSFVEIRGEWFIFDPYNGHFLTDDSGKLLSIVKLKKVRNYFLGSQINSVNFDYSTYIVDLPNHPVPKRNRANLQFPPNRLFFQINKFMTQRKE